VKVGDLIQSSAFDGQHGIVIETDHKNDADGSWYHVVWMKVNHNYALSYTKDWSRYEWCRKHEIEPRDIS
tara:strand:- start:351 stop:560 length:210 start_codon:yes stop_codon:yes gene_type:complete